MATTAIGGQVSCGTGVYVLEDGWGHSCGEYAFFSSIGELNGMKNVCYYTTVEDAMRFISTMDAETCMKQNGLKQLRIRELGQLELLHYLPGVLVELTVKGLL